MAVLLGWGGGEGSPWPRGQDLGVSLWLVAGRGNSAEARWKMGGGVGGFICGVEGRRAGMGRGRPGRERMSWVSNVTEARE